MNPRTENPDTFTDTPLKALEVDAREMVARCIECGSCYVDCAFGNYGDDPERCRAWIRQSNDFLLGRRKKLEPELVDANLKCAECNRCFNSCPEGIYRRHGNMWMKHRTGNPARNAVNLHPYANWRLKQPLIERLSVSKWPAEERAWYGRLNEPREAEVLLYHGCYAYLQAAQCLKLEALLDA
ncbi:MAG: hypothetical protein P1P84_25255, partial [Deferrisomatales bacterium]|nr:hypothetical protein [Deferrisomatales bacterium]